MNSQQLDDYKFLKFLGKGSFGEVFLTQKHNSSKLFATKKISKEKVKKENLFKYLKNEIDILKKLNHPNIVKLEDAKESTNHYFITMEYINGGDLSDLLKKYKTRYGNAFPEDIVKYLMRQIVEAVAYFHDKNIIHRDLKLDNIMVNFNNERDKENLDMMKAEIKIIDFGFATDTGSKENLARTAVGTALNMDPIILEKYNKLRDRDFGYGNKVDVWSMGTICYELLTGKPLFEVKTMNDLLKQVKEGNIKIPKYLSPKAINFLSNMFVYDSDYRSSAEELLDHPFIKKTDKFHNQKYTNNIDFKLQKGSLIYDMLQGNDKNKGYNISPNISTKKPISEEDIKINNNNNTYNNPHLDKLKNHYPSSKMVQSGYSFYGQPMFVTPPQMQRVGTFQEKTNNNPMNMINNHFQQPGYQGYPQPGYNNPPPMFQYGNYFVQNQFQNVPNMQYNYNNNNNYDNYNQKKTMKRNKTASYKDYKRKDDDGCVIF